MSTDGGEALTVMTWNIHHGVGVDRRLDLERVAEVIAEARPDVVGLQEIDENWGSRSGHRDQAALLASRLGMVPVFSPARTRSRPGRAARTGNALLTRLPVIRARAVPLPPQDVRGPWPEPRVLGHVHLRAGTGTIGVGVMHLDPGSPALRRAATAVIADRLRAEEVPTVLLGDVNARPGSTSLAPLRAGGFRELEEDLRAAGARERCGADRAVAAVPGPRRTARTLRVPATFPSPLPVQRLDAVFLRGAVNVEAVRVPHRPLASDHRPLVARIRLPG